MNIFLDTTRQFDYSPPMSDSFKPVGLTAVQKELMKIRSFRGIYSRVAKQLGISTNHVKEVSMGRRNSARVLNAIEREYKKIKATERAA